MSAAELEVENANIFSAPDFILKRNNGNQTTIDYNKYSKKFKKDEFEKKREEKLQEMENNNNVSRFVRSSYRKKANYEEPDDFDAFQMFKDYNFSSYRVGQLKSFLYKHFVKKLIDYKIAKWKGEDMEGSILGNLSVIQEEKADNKENNDAMTVKSYYTDKKVSKRFPTFVLENKNEKLDYRTIVLTTINFYWSKGYQMHP